MEIFDRVIQDTATLLSPYAPRTWGYRAEAARKESSPNELILLRDSAFELGGGSRPALTYSCATSNGSLVGTDQVCLYGPDLGEIENDVPFARIVTLEIADIGAPEDVGEDAEYKAVKDLELIKYKVFPEGYMMRARAMDLREQVRVSKQAIEEGISFESIGDAFIRKYKENHLVKAVRIVFITGELPVFKELAEKARKAEGITKAMNHVMMSLSMNCHSCDLKAICDEVEGLRDLHFKTTSHTA
jgi:CO dehydrogenase/acetyl-CoA synthase beta subunit